MIRRSSWWALLLVVQMLAAPSGPQQQLAPPFFKTATDLVLIDVSVLDRDGAPVADLRPDDFRITVDGRPRKVVSVEFRSQRTPDIRSEAASSLTPSAPRFATNQVAGRGRIGVIVVDELSLPLGSMGRVSRSIGRLLDSFGPSDRLALLALPGPRALVDFTNDYARIAEMIRTIACGRQPLPARQGAFTITETEAHRIRKDGGYASRLGFNLCEGAPQLMGRGQRADFYLGKLSPGACKALLRAQASEISLGILERVSRFSGDLTAVLRQLRDIDGPKQIFVLSQGYVTEQPFDLLPRAVEAVEARATVYTVRLDPSIFEEEALAADPDDLSAARTSLETLAGRTGGRAYEMYGSEETAFRRLATEVSASYVVAIETSEADRDGEAHRIDVHVDRPGTSVWARKEFLVRAPDTDEATRLSQALHSPLPASDLPLRLTAFNLADTDPSKVRVLVAAEIGRQQRGVNPAHVGVWLSDEHGRPLVSYTERLDLSAGGRDGALSFLSQTTVSPGRYTLRVAAIRDGRLGSAELQLHARVRTMGPLTLSDLVLNGTPVPQAPPAPSIDGRVSGSRLACAMQVGGDTAAFTSASFALEIAKSAQPTPLISVPATAASATPTTRLVEATVDISMLSPGDYEARLLVRASGQIDSVTAPFTVEAAPGR